MTEITPHNLLARGYREHPGTSDGESCFYQKCFIDDKGKKYFVEFREWDMSSLSRPNMIDTRICCQTDTDGYLWATFREDTIELAESRALKLWEASGSIYYEKIA